MRCCLYLDAVRDERLAFVGLVASADGCRSVSVEAASIALDAAGGAIEPTASVATFAAVGVVAASGAGALAGVDPAAGAAALAGADPAAGAAATERLPALPEPAAPEVVFALAPGADFDCADACNGLRTGDGPGSIDAPINHNSATATAGPMTKKYQRRGMGDKCLGGIFVSASASHKKW